jgi:hypothetical protein
MDRSRGVRKHSTDGGGSGYRVSSQSISPSLFFCLLLAEADGKHKHEEGRKQMFAREEKNHWVKKGEAEGFETPTTRINCGYRNISSHLGYLGNCAHVSYKSTPSTRTVRHTYHAYCYPTTVWGSGATPLHRPIIGLGR